MLASQARIVGANPITRFMWVKPSETPSYHLDMAVFYVHANSNTTKRILASVLPFSTTMAKLPFVRCLSDLPISTREDARDFIHIELVRSIVIVNSVLLLLNIG